MVELAGSEGEFYDLARRYADNDAAIVAHAYSLPRIYVPESQGREVESAAPSRQDIVDRIIALRLAKALFQDEGMFEGALDSEPAVTALFNKAISKTAAIVTDEIACSPSDEYTALLRKTASDLHRAFTRALATYEPLPRPPRKTIAETVYHLLPALRG